MTPSLIVNDKDGSHFTADAEDTILRAALRSGHGLSYECNSGGCGGCKFDLLDGDITTLWEDAPGRTARDRQRGKHLACQCKPVGAVRIRAAVAAEYCPPIPPQRHQVRLIAVQDITHDLREFRFKGDVPAAFLPGQFAMLSLPGVTGDRAYSLANLANPDGEWHFQIRRVPGGSGTAALFDQLTLGQEIGLDGPYGMAYLRPDRPRDLVCVAGGSGLAPMLSIARGAAAAGLLQNRTLHFFYGARSIRDVCGGVMLAELQAQGAQIRFIPALSHSQDGDGWSGERGLIHEVVARQLAGSLAEYEFYFAGPPPMTTALQEMLMLTHRVPFDHLHFDRFF